MRIDRPTAAALGVVVLWASAFPAIQAAAPDLGAVGLSFVRLAVAAVVLLAIGVVLRIRLPRTRDLGWIVAAGFFGMTAYQLLLNASELHVPAGTASIVVAGAPLVSVLVARMILREAITLPTLGGSAIALGGVAMVCLSRSGVSVDAAVALVVAAMAVQGIFHPLQRPLLRTYTGLEVATYTMVAGTVMTLPVVPLGWSELLEASPAGWAGAVYLGVFPSALGFVLWAYAVGRMPVAVSTSLLYLVPPIAVFIAWAWLGEIPLFVELWGGAVVIAGVVVISRGSRIPRRPRPQRWRREGAGGETLTPAAPNQRGRMPRSSR